MKTLINDIKTGNFKHVYLLTGEEAWLRRTYRDRLVRALMPDENSMNFHVYSGDRLSETEIIEQAETLPFFSDRRVICLDGTGLFRQAAGPLADYLKSVPDYLYMIFTEDDVDKRSRMYKAVRQNGAVIEFHEQTEAALSAWILRNLQEAGLQIRKGNMEYLLSRTGTDMTHILLETDKLIHYCTSSLPAESASGQPGTAPAEVTREDIDAVISDRTENRIFDMISAVTENRTGDALSLYADLLSLKEPPMRILYLTAQQYSRLLVIRELDAGGSPTSEIASKAGIPPFAVRKNLRLARSLTSGFLKDRLRACAEAEEAVKTGRLTDRLACELILMNR